MWRTRGGEVEVLRDMEDEGWGGRGVERHSQRAGGGSGWRRFSGRTRGVEVLRDIEV